jgi:muconolactone delta-isomerase
MNNNNNNNYNNQAVVFRRMTTQYRPNKINANVARLASEEKERTQALCAQGAILRNTSPAIGTVT